MRILSLTLHWVNVNFEVFRHIWGVFSLPMGDANVVSTEIQRFTGDILNCITSCTSDGENLMKAVVRQTFSFSQICIAHELNLVAKHATEPVEPFFELVNCISLEMRSNKLHAIMLKACNVDFLPRCKSFTAIRWNSHFFQLNRFLYLLFEGHFESLCEELTKNSHGTKLPSSRSGFGFQ